MPAAAEVAPPDTSRSTETLLETVLRRIAPTWPLDRFIAVNPLWGFIDHPVRKVAPRLAALCGASLLMPRAWYRQQLTEGRIHRDHLKAALEEAGEQLTVDELLSHLQHDRPEAARRALMVDVADTSRRSGRELPWREFVTQSLSQVCAAYFDDGQAQLRPDPAGGLYQCWRRWAVSDRGPSLLMGMGGYPDLAKALPEAPQQLMVEALNALAVPAEQQGAYLTALLLDLNGWAAWCAYQGWTSRLAGKDDGHTLDLLAMRLAWELLLLRAGGPEREAQWRSAMTQWISVDAAAVAATAHDWHFQRAAELAYQSDICRGLSAEGLGPSRSTTPEVQAAFCIDVRSEVFRRALEAQTDEVQTIGFAGFFGVPIEYLPLGAEVARPQLPGLLAPKLRATDVGVTPGLAAKRGLRAKADNVWKGLKLGPLSCFSFVESTGPLYLGKLLLESFGGGRAKGDKHPARPRLSGIAGGGELSLSERSALAGGVLRAMSLTHDFARLVVLVGHGSESTNNPFAAGLNCGACCGQTGEVNARVAAALLNERPVRTDLAQQGIHIPETTHFLPGLHNTTTDDVVLFDLDEVPASHTADVAALRVWLAAAGDLARRERAPKLGLQGSSGTNLRARCAARAHDWAEVRPEWGLADNAAFIVAPREHCQHLDLRGRSFLQDYRHEEDPEFKILELIMTAPMLVTHWINFQYYASTVDNRRFGSGNKLLHNVVGGHIGVFEGNGGDLRVGLPLQSLHDGERWVHTPLRLSVFIEAPTTAIDGVLQAHDTIRSLVENEWIYLFQFDSASKSVLAYRRDAWVPPPAYPAVSRRG